MEDKTMETTVDEQTGLEETAVSGETPETNTEESVVTAEGNVQEETQTEPGDEQTGAQSPAAEELVFTPVYNGVATPIKASDTDEVTTLLQLGMKQRAFLPTYEKLAQIAHESGAKSVDDFINSAFEANEKKHRDEAISRYGAEEGEKFYEYQKEQRGKAFSRYQQQTEEAARAEIQTRNEMLATQFVEMQQEYPDVAEFKDVPQAVINMSLEKGIHLMDAMARFQRSEGRKVADADAAAKKAASSTTGSMTDTPDAGEDPLFAAFMRGSNRHK